MENILNTYTENTQLREYMVEDAGFAHYVLNNTDNKTLKELWGEYRAKDNFNLINETMRYFK